MARRNAGRGNQPKSRARSGRGGDSAGARIRAKLGDRLATELPAHWRTGSDLGLAHARPRPSERGRENARHYLGGSPGYANRSVARCGMATAPVMALVEPPGGPSVAADQLEL